jgi:hypothetical protein
MELFNTDRARLAANTLLGVEISFGTLAFWSHAFEKGHLANFVVAALLTAFFGSLSLLASGVVTRAVSSREGGAPVTLALVAFCGVVLAIVGGFMTWHGLVWADSVAELLPGDAHDYLLIVGAALLSLLNLVAVYVFCRELKPVQRVARLEDPKTVAGRVLAMERHGKKSA